QNRWGQAAGITLAAIIFGLGHVPQGPAGVLLTGLLGIGLGWAMTLHRSLWVAVLAHGFFDAASFLGLWALEYTGKLKEIIPG
ncbi:MAG TPA: CPBP family intramembrane glutamic endopeptidase, partial [Candidatus Limnocylindria bacterium]|nr:CPBP family intramembrane glutamic endopeptidase [Candidatus Limnocylindria bacterium]